MKIICATIILSLIHLFVSANQEEKIVVSKIKSATVFLKGAQVYREGTTTLINGTNKIIFDDVSPYLNPKSIQASASNGALILDVKHSIFYNEPAAIKPQIIPIRIQKEITKLEDSIVLRQYELDMIKTIKNNLVAEKSIITNSKTMRGEGGSDSLPILIEAVKFYRERMQETEQEIFTTKLKIHNLSSNLDRMKNRLEELKHYNKNVQQPIKEKTQSHRITITIHSTKIGTSIIKVNYLVNNAGWYPSYDMRAIENKTIDLTYKASIFQNTEENWDNIDLTLSTYNQNCSFSVPSLAAWNLTDKKTTQIIGNRDQFQKGYMTLDSTMILSNAFQSNTYIPQEASFHNGKLQISQSTTPVDDFLTSVSNSQMQSALNNIEFEIDQKYSISPDGQEVLLVIKNETLKTDFQHMSIPKVNTDAFLLAKITGWENMNLLSAKSNIYFNNTYVGETFLNPNVLSDTLEIALAREKGIITSRKKTKDNDKKSNLGKNISREITIELAVKNNKNEATKMQLKDQIPVSKQKGVTVKLVESDDAKLDDSTGLLTWNLQMNPNETKVISFTYRVEYDKDMEVL